MMSFVSCANIARMVDIIPLLLAPDRVCTLYCMYLLASDGLVQDGLTFGLSEVILMLNNCLS